MLVRSANTVIPVVTIHANFGAAETSYVCGQQIHGEGEWANRVYEVMRGAVRNYKTLSDGRRQICAFHLPNDIFGWENGPTYRFTAEAIVDTTVRVVRRQNLEYVAATNVQVTHSLLSMTTRNLEHAQNQMMLLGRKNSLEKVAAFLLEMDRRLFGTDVLARGILKFTETSQRQIVLKDRQELQALNS